MCRLPTKRSQKRRAPATDALLWQSRISHIRRATLEIDGRSEQALLIDLGLRGAFIERAEPLTVGGAARLTFFLPGNELAVEARCRVAWCHTPDRPLRSKQLPPGVGLEFVALDDDDRRRLEAFLAEHFARDPRARQFARPWIDELEEPPE